MLEDLKRGHTSLYWHSRASNEGLSEFEGDITVLVSAERAGVQHLALMLMTTCDWFMKTSLGFEAAMKWPCATVG